MKKVFIISMLFLGATACQKQDIRPNTPVKETETFNTKSSSDEETTSTTPGSTDPSTGDDGTSITDPLRKKNPKDNK